MVTPTLNPKFNVLAKTEEYVATQTVGDMSEDWYADDYILRGPGKSVLFYIVNSCVVR